MKKLIETGLLFENYNTFTDSGKMYLQGIVQRANSKNKNGRIYPRDILERKVDDYIKEYIEHQIAYGELDHPESQIVEMKNAAFHMEDLWWKGDDLYGKLEILDTPCGNIVRAVAKAGKSVGISSRAMGSTEWINESNGEETEMVQEDLEIVCWDIVSNPSTHRAFVSPKLNESRMIKESIEVKKDNKLNDIFYDIICNMTGKCSLKG